ncbi:MAG: hypothetical protein RBS48_07630 [Ignavibacteriaceae bacterium]|jgi:hypothetical protein|nr:hypothetical protein [Ignavibacteriaceae bacterium]
MFQNKIKFLPIIIFLILSQTPFHAQGTYNHEIAVTFISAGCFDTTYRLSRRQVPEYSSHQSYVIDKFVYKIRITIKLSGNGIILDRPLALTCYYPPNGSKTIIVNQENYPLNSDEDYEYMMVVKTKEKGWAKISVCGWDEDNLRLKYFDGIKYIDSSFYFE